MEPREKDASLKITETLRDEVNTVASEMGGKTQKEIVEYFLELHRQNREMQAGDAVPNLDLFRSHHGRVEAMYIEMYRIGRDRELKDSSTIEGLANELMTVKSRLFEMQETLNTSATSQEAEIQAIRAEAALIKENAGKEILQMQERITQAEKSEQQAQQLVKLAQEAADVAKQKAEMNQEKSLLVDEMTDRVSTAESTLSIQKREMEDLNRKHQVELEQAALQHDRERLKVEREYMEKISILRERNAELSIQIAQTRKNDADPDTAAEQS